MDLRRPAKAPVYTQVVEKIRHLIRTGGLGPGDQLLPERQLAEILGVSRSSLREALAALAGMGVLEISPRDGAYVRRRSLEDAVEPLAQILYQERQRVYHLFEVREIIETQAARLAATRATPGDIEHLRALNQRVEEDIRSGRAADHNDFNFHIGLVSVAKNPLLLHVMQALATAMTEVYGPTRRRLMSIPAEAARFAQEHAQIIDTVAAGDPKQAERRMQRHLQHARRRMEDVQKLEFDQEGTLEPPAQSPAGEKGEDA